MSDLIDRQHAIDEIRFYITEPDISDDETKIEGYNDGLEMAISILSILSSAEPEPEEFEWCTDCKEYDQKQHCCHRWTKVIRQTVEEMKSAEPERKTGKWLHKPNEYDDNTYECSRCGEPWTLIEGTPKENNMNYCPNCGSEMTRGE